MLTFTASVRMVNWVHRSSTNCGSNSSPAHPSCFSFDVEWTKACGRGTVYSYTVCLRPAPGFENDVPYNIALVELAEGVRMMSTVVDCPPDDLRIGMLVEVVFEDVIQDVTLPKFKPAGNPPSSEAG